MEAHGCQQSSFGDRLDAMAGLRVVVLGDFFLDEYVECRLVGVSPEMPVPRLERGDACRRPGAAGNLAAGLAALGARVTALGVVGDDAAGDRVSEALRVAGVDVESLVREPGRPTPTVTRFTTPAAGGPRHYLRVDRVPREEPSRDSLARLSHALGEALADAALVFVADYDEAGGAGSPGAAGGVVRTEVLQRVREAAAKSGARLFGTSRLRPGALSGFEVVIGNQREVGLLGVAPEASAAEARAVLEEHELAALCVTCGAEGAQWLDAEGWRRFAPRPSVEVDPCGAGDSFAAALALALASGAGVDEAGRLAAAAGGLAVERAGTEVVDAARLRRPPASPASPPPRAGAAVARKLRTLDALGAELAPLRAAGGRVVFTNGCFDVFHPGHLRLLREARALGDCLVVALNSDRSTAANKGPGRPVIAEPERVEMLAGLEAVDYVTVFDELTPVHAIARLRPDVLVKGGNYRPDEVVGRALVEEQGGEVVIVPQRGGFDTGAFMAAVSRASDGHRS